MAKRSATSDINHDNWDAPFEAEEAGKFKPASTTTLEKRIIKTAKRRIKPSDGSDANKTAFSSFAGFKPTVPTLGSTGSSIPFTFLSSTSSVSPSTNVTISTTAKMEVTPQQKYLADLQQLNRGVSDWIKTHVDNNPVCILTPVFKDYEKHLKKIQEDRDSEVKSVSASVTSAPSSHSSFTFGSGAGNNNKFTIDVPTSVESSKKSFSFLNTNVNKDLTDSNNQLTSSLLFGASKDSGKSPLSRENQVSDKTTSSIFSKFNSESAGSSLFTKPDPASLMVNPFTSVLKKEEGSDNKQFSFSNGPAPQSSSNTKEDEEAEDSDEPPKVQFTPVQEDDSVFSTRCKVFVKKDSNYNEKGVGTLFIKKVGEEKYQLLVRAETVLGNILLNVLLSSAIPLQRMGKNNVMLVCLPTPQDLPPPTTVLLRVKTAGDADDLLATLEKYKN